MHRKKNLVDAFHQFISYGHYHILDDDTEGQLKKKAFSGQLPHG